MSEEQVFQLAIEMTNQYMKVRMDAQLASNTEVYMNNYLTYFNTALQKCRDFNRLQDPQLYDKELENLSNLSF